MTVKAHYNVAYLDEQTNRMIRRAILKAINPVLNLIKVFIDCRASKTRSRGS